MTDGGSTKPERQVHEQVPLPFLLAAGGLVALTLGLIGFSLLTGTGDVSVLDGKPVAMREVRFEDRASGAVAVFAAEDGRLIAEVEPGAGGFLRGTLRALARERRQHGAGGTEPFRLIRTADGRLMLTDTATGRSLVLDAFGPTNKEAFASLLTSGTRQP